MLYIMRHGRTVWNMEHKLQGKTDVPLSEAGRPVVEQAAAAYRDTHIDVCYCSPLIRRRIWRFPGRRCPAGSRARLCPMRGTS